MRDVKDYDALVLVTPEVFGRLASQYHYMAKYLPVKRIRFLGSEKAKVLFEKAKKSGTLTKDPGEKEARKFDFVSEDDIIPFSAVHSLISNILKDVLNGRELPRGVTGWYYQQFLKLSYSFVCEDEYYLTWDGDTIPCADFSMFSGGDGQEARPYFDVKREYHAEYFDTLRLLIPGLEKVIGPSFIAEHMIFKKDLVQKLIAKIELNSQLEGNVYWEKILNCIGPDRMTDSSFSEFETYGTFTAVTNPAAYKLRQWHSFRLGGTFFDPDTICERDYEWLGKDFTAISFEKNQTVREDDKGLFDNPVYQSKLSAKQMLQIAQEEFKDGYIEVWEEDDAFSAANTTSGDFKGADEIQSPYKPGVWPERLKYLGTDSWEKYDEMGDRLTDGNPDQGYLCYEYAEFLCDDGKLRDNITKKKDELSSKYDIKVKKACFIICSYNCKYLMQKCLESIYINCDPRTYSIVVLDNASADGVDKWLESQQNDRVKVILSPENLGFPRGCNEAVKNAPIGEDIFLLNNDTRVCAGALFNMRMALYSSGDVGAVGAMQNYSGAQIIDVTFDLPEQYMEFGARYNYEKTGEKYAPMRKLSGFALLIRRNIYDRLNGFDETFSPGYFEDDDLCERIRIDGKRLLLARNSFIYHAGSQNFIKREDLDEIFNRNKQLFMKKWNYDSYTKDPFLHSFDASTLKLIIWDLDNTFWRGILSEEKVSPIPEMIEIVRKAANKGIINSVCSKNDPEKALDMLSSEEFDNIREYFVFPSINWEPKGNRIKQILEDMSLRAENTLFIDDDDFNLREASFVLPALSVMSPANIRNLSDSLDKIENNDMGHDRLNKYKILEQKRTAQKAAASNHDFLMDSRITISLEYDCLSHTDRVCELIERTNQLNYTKIRSSKDEVLRLLKDENYTCALVNARDRFGDYGKIGFLAMSTNEPGTLLHFVFSCRVIGMGIEQFLYNALGCPQINISGSVAVELEPGKEIDWISVEENEASAEVKENAPDSASKAQPGYSPKVLLKGPCDIDGITPYLESFAQIELETNFVDERGIVVAGSNNSTHIYELFNSGVDMVRDTLSRVPFLSESDFLTFMFKFKYDAIVFSTLTEVHSGVYRDKKNGLKICFGSSSFDLTNPDNRNQYISGEYQNNNVKFTDESLKDFAENFEYLGHAAPEESVRNIKWIREKLSPETTLILLLGSEIDPDNNAVEFKDFGKEYKILNSMLYEAFADADNVWLLNITDYITGQDCFEGCTNHYSKKVYHEIAEDLKNVFLQTAQQ